MASSPLTKRFVKVSDSALCDSCADQKLGKKNKVMRCGYSLNLLAIISVQDRNIMNDNGMRTADRGSGGLLK